MRRALALLLVVPLLPMACGSFGAGTTPTDAEAGVSGPDTGIDAPPPGLPDGATVPPVGEIRVPPECPIRGCPDDVPGDDCKDDECEEEDFTVTGGASREDGRCKLAPVTTGYFESDRPRRSTPSRFAELAFDLISADSAASAVISQLFVAGSVTPRVDLVASEGGLSLCVVTDTETTCAAGNVALPQQPTRIHFYGVVDRTAGAPQNFGVRLDCTDVLQIAVPAAFGPGEAIVARVGCMDAPCTIVADDLVFFTRP